MDFVHELFEGLLHPETEFLLVVDAGEAGEMAGVEAHDAGGIGAGVDRGARHHDDEFGGEAFDDIEAGRLVPVDTQQDAVDDGTGAAAVALLNGVKEGWFFEVVEFAEIGIVALFRFVDSFRFLPFDEGRGAVEAQEGGVGEVVRFGDVEKLLAGLGEEFGHGPGVVLVSPDEAWPDDEPAEDAIVKHDGDGPDHVVAGTGDHGRLAPAQRFGDGKGAPFASFLFRVAGSAVRLSPEKFPGFVGEEEFPLEAGVVFAAGLGEVFE